MADERTASTFTWLNSHLRSSQKAATLVRMTQIRQWYLHQVCTEFTYDPLFFISFLL